MDDCGRPEPCSDKRPPFDYLDSDVVQTNNQTSRDGRIGVIPGAAAKVDAADRHRDLVRTNQELIESYPHLLGSGDFAWGDSAYYMGAVAGGSGLTWRQDAKLGNLALQVVIDRVNAERARWLKERRANGRSHSWLNQKSQPGEEYLAVRKSLESGEGWVTTAL